MTTYESKIVTITRRAEDIYNVLADFRNFTPFVPKDKIGEWSADESSCRFNLNGIGPAGLKFVEREPHKTLKITGDGGIPLEFYLWVQLKEVAPYDSRLRIVLSVELNTMMKMMLNKKLEEGVNAFAEMIAAVFNTAVR